MSIEPVFVQTMILRQIGEKSLNEPKEANLLEHIDSLVQDCGNSISNALKLLKSCTKPSTYASLGPAMNGQNAAF